MADNILKIENDPMGQAIYDYFTEGKASQIKVYSSMFDDDTMSVSELFKSRKELSEIEKKALMEAKGRILDVGAGSGRHSLILQEDGKSVKAIDISPLSVEVMKKRGVKDAECLNLYDKSALNEKFDTILLLMNGSGIIGKISNIPNFLNRIKELLNPGGMILMDSSDLIYLYENEDGSVDIDLNSNYYGEVDYQMEYRGKKGTKFDWLYIDFYTLSMYAEMSGFSTDILEKGEHYDYLAKLTLI